MSWSLEFDRDEGMSNKPCVIFVHGIKGGHLRNKQDKKIWLRLIDLFSNRDTGLASPIGWEDGLQKKDGVKSDGPIKRILWKSVYAPFLSGMKRKGWRIFNFKHDWRRNQLEIASELIEYINQITDQYGSPLLVAHSNGGIISDLAIRNRTCKIRGILYAGVPFGSGVSFLPDMTHGEQVLRNKMIGDAMVHFSWAAPWTYFPLSDATSRLLDEQSSPMTHDWYSFSSWAEHGLGPFFQNSDLSDKQLSHMENALHRAKEIRELIESPWPEGHSKPPIFVLRSGDHDTPAAYKLENGEWNIKNPVMKNGDGRILFESALPPYGIEADYLTPNGHGALLNNVNQIDMILNAMATALPLKA